MNRREYSSGWGAYHRNGVRDIEHLPNVTGQSTPYPVPLRPTGQSVKFTLNASVICNFSGGVPLSKGGSVGTRSGVNMRGAEGRPANELERAIDNQRLGQHIDRLALLAFAEDELAALPADIRNVLMMLTKRRMAVAGMDLGVGDMLRIRQQVEDYQESRLGNPAALRLAAQLR